MKLHLAKTDGMYAFTGYGDGYVAVNGTPHHCNVLVQPRELTPNWTQVQFETLTMAEFALLAGLDAEILLLGTGAKLRFPPPALMQPIYAAGKGLEVMDTPAACRTYNILVAEGRKVACALLV